MNFVSQAPAKRIALTITLLLCLAAARAATFAQEASKPAAAAAQDSGVEEVLRINASIVQTDVMVFDGKGRFVDDLQREHFELQVDGQTLPLLFFERVTAGSADEAARIAAARGESASSGARSAAATGRGRSVIFFVDDLHLSPEGLERARRLLLNFVDKEMTPDTHAMIASASGQVGFLQQFTNDKAVLRAAVRRIKYQSRSSLDRERPAMSDYQALAVDRGNRDALEYFVTQTIYESRPQALPRELAMTMVTSRARRIRRQAALSSAGVISSLEGVVAARSPSNGRQTLFFISEGFAHDDQGADTFKRMQRAVAAAARTGTVIYTLDARGLAVGMLDASSSAGADLLSETADGARGFAGNNPSVELSATQEVLRQLASDTGGRALLNTNALEAAVSKTLGETSHYYLLAWRPESDSAAAAGLKKGSRKVEVRVKGRPDLTVRVRRGLLDTSTESARGVQAPTVASDANAALNAVLNAPRARRELPVELYASFTNDAQAGSVVTASVQITDDVLAFALNDSQPQAGIDVACVVFDDRGKAVYSTGRNLTLARGARTADDAGDAPAVGRSRLIAIFPVPVSAPGLYQVRVAARDSRGGGLVGSAFQWVEVPDLKPGGMSLSSLLLAEAGSARGQAVPPNVTPGLLRVDRRFARSSHLHMQLYIYNAARGGAEGAPDVELEIKIQRGGEVVLSAPPHKVALAAATDRARIRYAAEVPLQGMAAGTYLLHVTVTDRVARTSATRQLDFVVE